MRLLVFACILVSSIAVAAADGPVLVGDLVRHPETLADSTPTFHAALDNGIVIFSTALGGFGGAIWRTDGTIAGTFQLIDPSEASPVRVLGTARSGDVLYLGVAETGRYRILKTDGSRAGTVAVTEVTTHSPLVPVAADGEKVYYLRDSFRELWMNAPSGEQRLARISEEVTPRTSAVIWRDHLYLGVVTGLWKSDGTAAGTVRLTPSPSFDVISASDRVFFAARDAATGGELWTTDGTTAATRIVSDFTPGGEWTFSENSGTLAALGNGVVFLTLNGEVGFTDGSSGGTRSLRKGIATEAHPSDIAVLNGVAYFAFNDGVTARRLWRTDGTVAGTHAAHAGIDYAPYSQIVADAARIFYYAAVDGMPALLATDGTQRDATVIGRLARFNSSAPSLSLLTAGDRVFFSFDENVHGLEPWMAEANDTITLLANAAVDRGGSSYPRELQASDDGSLHFLADSDDGVRGVWRTNGNEDDAVRVASAEKLLAVLHGRAYLRREESQLWVRNVDGTETLLHDFDSSERAGLIFNAQVMNDVVYIEASAELGDVLWATRGTAESTHELKRAWSQGYFRPLSVAGRTYFVHYGFLYTTDGTPAGTQAVANAPGNDLFAFEGALYAFRAGDGWLELWRNAGGAGGETLVKRIPTRSYDAAVAMANGQIFFITSGLTLPYPEIWRSDGTPDGTYLVREIATYGAGPTEMITLGNKLIVALETENGVEPWVSDGTLAGTRELRDINPGASSYPTGFTRAAGRVYFAAYDPLNGRELWETDGTPAGTRPTADVARGASSSDPHHLTAAGSTLYFAADTLATGVELWALALEPLVEIETNDVRVNETSARAFVTVKLTTAASDPTRVDYATEDRDAVAGTDYVATRGTLVFAAGETLKTIEIPILAGAEPRRARVFVVELRSATVNVNQAAAVIIDNDAMATDLQVAVDPKTHEYVITNPGSPFPTTLRICFSDPTQATWSCEDGHLLQPAAEIRRELSYDRGSHVVSVTSFDADSDLSNNSITWFATNMWMAMTMTPPVVRVGDEATLVLANAYPFPLLSSNPSVASIRPSVDVPNGQRFPVVPVKALAPGFASIAVKVDEYEQARLPLRVIAPGEPLRSIPMVWLDGSNAWIYGESSDIRAEVSGFTADGRGPSGTVTFYANGVAIGEEPVVQNRAMLSGRSLAPGQYEITATYSGDHDFFETESVSAWPAAVLAYASIAVRRVGAEQVEITMNGAPGHPPAGTVRIGPPFTTEWISGTLTASSDSSSSVRLRIAPGATSIVIHYTGDSFYQPGMLETTVPAGSSRARAVRH